MSIKLTSWDSLLDSFLDLFQRKIRYDKYQCIEFKTGKLILETITAGQNDIFAVWFFEYNDATLGKIKLGYKKNTSFFVDVKEAVREFNKRAKHIYKTV